MKTPPFYTTPKGEHIRLDFILAIHKLDAEYGHKSRIILDIGIQPVRHPLDQTSGYNSLIIYCETNEERDALADTIYAQIEAALRGQEDT